MIRQIYFNFVNKGLEHWYYKDHRQRIEIITTPKTVNGQMVDIIIDHYGVCIMIEKNI